MQLLLIHGWVGLRCVGGSLGIYLWMAAWSMRVNRVTAASVSELSIQDQSCDMKKRFGPAQVAIRKSHKTSAWCVVVVGVDMRRLHRIGWWSPA